jgi:hypothetical protein
MTTEFARTKSEFKESQGLPFSRALSSDEIESAITSLGYEYRDRVFNPIVTLWAWLNQAISQDHSCKDAVARVRAWQTSEGLNPCSMATGGYCQARSRLPCELFPTLARRIAERIDPKQWLWNGRNVKIVDATTFRLEDTDENQERYPQVKTVAPGLGFPQMRALTIHSLATGMIHEATFGPLSGKKTGELSLLTRMLDSFKPGDVLVGDRAYDSACLHWLLMKRDVKFVIRQTSKTPIDTDHVVIRKKPYNRPVWMSETDWEAMPKSIELRQITGLVFNREVVLLTTLDEDAGEIIDLYRQRWHCEVDYRDLKQTLNLVDLRCHTPDMAEKEVWMGILAYNLIRAVMGDAATEAKVKPRTISYKATVQVVLAFFNLPYREVIKAVGQTIVGGRVRDSEPRFIKRRPKFHYLTVPRVQAKAFL